MRKLKYQRGQSLVEVLLALAVAVLVITAITSVVIVALNNTTFSKNQNLANAYAQEGIEFVRALRDKSYSTLLLYNTSAPNSYCLAGGSTVPVAKSGPDCDGEGNIQGGFIREIFIHESVDCEPGGDFRRVIVTVSWKDGKCTGGNFCHRARINSCIGRADQTVGPP
ncbi:MAG: hypothetical protein A2687_02215 [Candidatus Levybacteria bacterium RIFCSPHIGHO2_01_FULL_38_26]|nr:MAG: hypothetical protein A2687_02215 [Candidatus Levybacteria bacterium RIFCSPHIGHO2_01_FULL_38_26]